MSIVQTYCLFFTVIVMIIVVFIFLFLIIVSVYYTCNANRKSDRLDWANVCCPFMFEIIVCSLLLL